MLQLAVVAAAAVAELPGVRVDMATSTWRDSLNRTRVWHGTNFVQKGAPYYPTVTGDDIKLLQTMGMTAVRLGVMMDGLFPTSPTPSTEYLGNIHALLQQFQAADIAVILDLHQDVLSPAVCGEGFPDWMVNVSTLDSLEFPRPLEGVPAVPANPATGEFDNKTCSATGILKFIGWSELYLTDACGKAFQQIYDGVKAPATRADTTPLHWMVDLYWETVSKEFAGHPAVLAYEVMNEPWYGDVLSDPLLLLEGGVAEKKNVGPMMERMHTLIRQNDKATPVLYSPAELNNRFMRPVGYERGFLPGEPMAWHVYCLTGTDGDGPTTNLTKELCHFNDGDQFRQREKDLKRLQTAGFVTEFGAVSAKPTGLAEVKFVLDALDAADPPLSWTFWSGIPSNTTYQAELARPYARAIAGTPVTTGSPRFDPATNTFTLVFTPNTSGETTEVVLSSLVYPQGWHAVASPEGCCTTKAEPYGVALTVNAGTTADVTLVVTQT